MNNETNLNTNEMMELTNGMECGEIQEVGTNKAPIIGFAILGVGAIAATTLIIKAIRNKKSQKPKKPNLFDRWAEDYLLKRGYAIAEPLEDLSDGEEEVKVNVEKKSKN